MKEKVVNNPLIACLLFAAQFFTHTVFAAQTTDTFVLPQDSRVPGGVAVIALIDKKANQKASLENKQENKQKYKQKTNSDVRFNGQRVWQLIDAQQNHWAIIGIPLSQKVGPVPYTVNGKTQYFSIVDKAYKEQRLTVKRKHSNPPADQIERIQRESRLSKQAFTTFSNGEDNHSFQGFLKPAQGPTSSPFGLKRFFNDQPRRPHSGLDIAGPRGSNIIAPADGTIILTGKFFFNGNSIFIDHGQGLITMYCHMDVLERNLGEVVKAGDIIGTIGATGRVTGPHLHWTVSLNNSRVDPLLFLKSDEQ